MNEQLVADIYIRESNEELARGYSPTEMVEQCRAKVTSLGMRVGEVVVEVAKRDEYDPPKLMGLVERARRGLSQAVVSHDMFRLSGELGKHLSVRDQFARAGAALYFATQEFADTDEGRLHEIIVGGIGGWERAKIRSRTQNGIKGKLDRGELMCNGKAPYGLQKVTNTQGRPSGYEPHPKEMPVLQRIIRDAQTMTLADICLALNAEGIATPGGKARWTPGMLSPLLSNPTYEGHYRFRVTKKTRAGRGAGGKLRYHAEQRPESEIDRIETEPYVDLSELRAARAALARRLSDRKPRGDAATDTFALRGLVRCAGCGGVLSARPAQGYRWYTCGRAYPRKGQRAAPGFVRCPLPQVRADELEAYVWAELGRALADDERLEEALARAVDGGEQVRRYREQIAVVETGIVAQQRRIDNAADTMLDAGRGTRTYEHALSASREAERALAELEQNLASLARQAPRVLRVEDADWIRGVFRDARAGYEDAIGDPSLQRRVYRALAVEVELGTAQGADGVKLGRDHRWTVAPRGHVAFGGSDKDSQGSLSLWETLEGDPLALRGVA